MTISYDFVSQFWFIFIIEKSYLNYDLIFCKHDIISHHCELMYYKYIKQINYSVSLYITIFHIYTYL